MGTRAAGGYVGMSEGWLGTVCALFLRSFNAATTLLKEHKNNAHTLHSNAYLSLIEGGIALIDINTR